MTPEEISCTYDFFIVIRRWVAMWTDALILVLLLAPALLLGDLGKLLVFIGWTGISILYIPTCEAITGQTLGKWMCGLKVVNAQGSAPGAIKALLRWLARLVEINPFLMGAIPAWIVVCSSPKRQRIGDMIAGTYVLHVEDLPFLDPTFAAAQGVPPAPLTPAPVPAKTKRKRLPALPTYQPRWCLSPALLATLMSAGLLVGGHLLQREFTRRHQPQQVTGTQLASTGEKGGYYNADGLSLDVGNAFYEYTYVSEGEEEPPVTGVGRAQIKDTTATVPPLSELTTDPSDAADRISVVYAPVVTGDGEKVRLLVETRSEEVKDQLAASEVGTEADQKQGKENSGSSVMERSVKGTLKEASDLPEKTREDLQRLMGGFLAKDFRVLREGDEPTPYAEIMAQIVGFFVAVLAVIFWGGPDRKLCVPTQLPDADPRHLPW